MICWQSINKFLNCITTLILALTCSVERLGCQAFQDGGNVCSFFTQTLANCSGRGLYKIPSNLPPSLQYLDLSHNKITGIHINDFKNLTKLRKLKLNNNQIAFLDGPVFNGLTNLIYLDLSANSISILPNDVFAGLINLHTLLFNENRVISVRKNAFKGLSSLRDTSLKNKKLYCSCEIIWLSEWLKKHMLYIRDVLNFQKVTCYKPFSQKHIQIARLYYRHTVILMCHGHLKLHRKRRSAKASHWSCAMMSNGNGKYKVVPLDVVSTTTSNLHDCIALCLTAGNTYGSLSGSDCLCGDMKSVKYNAGQGCKVSCPGTAASCLPYISPSNLLVVADYSAGNDLLTSSSNLHASSPVTSPVTSSTNIHASSPVTSPVTSSTHLHSSTTQSNSNYAVTSLFIESSAVVASKNSPVTFSNSQVPHSASAESVSLSLINAETDTRKPELSVGSETSLERPEHISKTSAFPSEMDSKNTELWSLITGYTESDLSSTIAASKISLTSMESSEQTTKTTAFISQGILQTELSNTQPNSLTTGSSELEIASSNLNLEISLTSIENPKSRLKTSAATWKATSESVPSDEGLSSKTAGSFETLSSIPMTPFQIHDSSILETDTENQKLSTIEENILDSPPYTSLHPSSSIESLISSRKTSSSATAVIKEAVSSRGIVTSSFFSPKTSISVDPTTSEAFQTDIKTSFNPAKSSSAPTILMTETKSETPYVTEHHRTARDLSSSSLNTASVASIITDTLSGFGVQIATTFAQASDTALSEVYVSVSYTDNGVQKSLLWKKINDELEVQNFGINIIDKNTTIAIPPGKEIDFTVVVYFGNKNNFNVSFSYDNITQTNVMIKCKDKSLCNSNKSRISSFNAVFTEETSKNVSFVIKDETVSSARIILKLTILNPVRVLPSLISNNDTTYVAKSEKVLSAFKTSFRLVQAIWKIRNEEGQIVFQNQSFCTQNCPKQLASDPSCLQPSSDSCFLWLEYSIDIAGTYNITVEFSNPVTNVPLVRASTVLVETRISSLVIASCDYFANINENKIFTAKYKGDNANVIWYLNGQPKMRKTNTFNYTFQTTGTKNVSVVVYNNINKVTAEREITVFHSGSVHGLTIIKPSSDIYYPTNKELTLKAQLCEGDNPQLEWNFDDGTSFTTNDTVVKHQFNYPRSYTIRVKATNFANKTEETTTILHLQNEIKNFTAHSNKTLAKVNENFNVVFAITDGTDVSFSINKIDKNIQVSFSKNNSADLSISSAGTFSLIFSAENKVSKFDAAVFVTVQEAIKVVLDSFIYSPMEANVTLIASKISGSHMLTKWDFGDKMQTGWIYTDVSPTINHVYKSEGRYSLTLKAYNNVSSDATSAVVIVQRPLDIIKNKVTVATRSYVATNESINVTITVDQASIYGYNISGAANFLLLNNTSIISRTFSTAGRYKLNFLASNQVSNVSASVVVIVQDKLLGGIEIYPLYVVFNTSQNLTAFIQGTDPAFNFTFSNGNKATGKSVKHIFTDLGKSIVNITARNKISEVSSSVILNVELPINNLTLIANATAMALNNAVLFQTSLNDRPDLTYKWNISNINVDYSADSIVWKFSTLGSHWVSVNVQNHIESVTATMVIEVQALITGLQIKVVSNRSLTVVPFNETIILAASVNTGSNTSYFWTLDLPIVTNKASDSIQFLVEDPRVRYINVTLAANNKISRDHITHIFPVIHRIGNVVIFANTTNTIPNETVRMWPVYTTGSNISTAWFVDGAFVANTSYLDFKFLKAATYNIKVILSNAIGSQQASLGIIIQDLISFVRMYPVVTATNKTTEFHVSALKGTDPEFHWKLPANAYSLNSISSYSKRNITFLQSGIYTLFITTKNLVHNINTSFVITVQDRLLGLEIMYSNIFYPTQRPVNFSASITRGSSVQFDWLFRARNIIQKYSDIRTVRYIFTMAGSYDVIVKASNLISSDEKSIRFYAQDVAVVTSIYSNYGNILPTKQSIFLTTTTIGTNLTIDFVLAGNVVNVKRRFSTVNFTITNVGYINVTVKAFNKVSSDEKSIIFEARDRITGLSLWASRTFVPVKSAINFEAFVKSGSSISYDWKINRTLVHSGGVTLQRIFSKSGIYEVTVLSQNGLHFPSEARSVTVRVESAVCQPPKIAILGGKKRDIFQSQWLYIEAFVDYNCSSSSVSSNWVIKTAKIGTNCILQQHQLNLYSVPLAYSSDVSFDAPLLVMPPGSLQFGYYCLIYTATFGQDGRFKSVDTVHVKVRQMPPDPIILGGPSRIIGFNQSFVLEAASATSPNLQSDLLYKWTCVAKPSNASEVISSPGCTNSTWNAEKKIHVQAGTLGADTSYEFGLHVKRQGQTPVHRTQKIHIIPGKVVEAFIECVTCKIYNSLKYVKERVLKIIGRCNNCLVSGKSLLIEYKWQIISSNGTVLNYPARITTDIMDVIVIKENTFDGISKYKTVLTVNVIGDSFKKGESVLLLSPNLPPRNGTCDLSPASGRSLQTLFSYNCQNWKDEDNINIPFIYWLVVVNWDLSRDILYRGIKGKRSFHLPVGDKVYSNELRLQILVEDILGATTIGLQRHVFVYPPITNNVANFLEDNVLPKMSLLVQENDLSKVIVASQATVKLLSETSSIGLKEQAIISNVTGYTSRMSASTLESIEQLSTTLKFSMNLLPESSVMQRTRQDLTNSLKNIVKKVNSWAERGQLGSSSSLNALLFLAQNNIAAEGLAANTRQRRAIPNSISSLKTNLNLVMQLYTSVLRGSLRGEDAKRYSTKYGSAILKRSSPSVLSKALAADGCSFEVSRFNPPFTDVFQIFNTSFYNPYSTLSGAVSTVAGLSYSLPNGTVIPVKNLPVNESIVIKLDTSKNTVYSFATKLISPNSFAEGELLIGMPIGNSSLLRVDFVVHSANINMVNVYLRPGYKPLDEDTKYLLKHSSSVQNSRMYSHVYMPGEFSSSVKHFIRIKNRDKEQKLNISIIAYAVSCQFWDRKNQVWDTHGCEPTNQSNLHSTVCRCNHLTSFASAFKIAPNPIKWSTLEELDIERNPIAVSACLVLIVLYLVSLFFASRKDEEDRREAQFIPMLSSDEYFKYEIRIKTGVFPGAGTTANVGIKIYGTKCTSKPIVLTKEGSFQRNSVDLFRFASVSRLGKIIRIQVWHNNAGSSPSWYLSRVVIKNILSGEKFFFFCNSWLAVDRGDGQIDRHFDVADEKMMAKFSTIFNDVVGRTFTDYHLWVSLFEKPKLSRFTRVQRVTCCATFLLSWMCVDAMWFGTAKTGKTDLYLGFKGYSYEEVVVGVISSLMVFPINMIFVLIFRKSRLPHSRQILDGEEEVTIHILPNHRRARRLSEDWIEIEDNRPSGPPKLATSLPRCGGVIGLNSYQRMVAVHELPYEDGLIDIEAEEEDTKQNSKEMYTAEVNYSSQQSNEFTFVSASESSNVLQAIEEPTYIPKFSKRISKQYTRIPFPSLQEEDENIREPFYEQECSDRKPILPNRFSKSEIEPRNLSFSEQQLVTHINDFKARSSNVSEYTPNQMKYQDFNDSFSSKQSSYGTISSFARTLSEPRFEDQLFTNTDAQESKEIPDIREYHSSLECSLPSWCTIIGYFACLAVSVLSFVVILIYGQQFGKEKAIKWIASLLSGLVQDIFVTYPVLLVVVAVVVALFRKPMNLDYSDFVMCPVVPGDCNVSSEPLRGYALEIAQRQGRNKRRLRKLLKKCIFQFVHLWMIFSICLTSYESNMAAVKKNFESRLTLGTSGSTSVQSIGQLWLWTENKLPSFLYPDREESDNWHLRSVPRIRQIRVRSLPCIPVSTAVETVTINRTCASDYEKDHQETRDFSNGWNLQGPLKNSPWTYYAEKDLNGTKFLGEFSTYPHSGYIMQLSKSRAGSLHIIRSLKAAGWLDSKSRAVFVEFTLKNFNINQYAVVTILFEISTTGMIISNFEVLYTRIHMYTRNIDYFRLLCEVIFGLLTFYLIWHLVHRIAKHQAKIFYKFWDIHSMFVCAVSATVIALYIYRLIIFLKIRPYLKTGVPQGYDLRHEAIVDWAAQACMGFLCFLVIIKVVTLLSMSSSYEIIGATLKGSCRHFFTAFIGFAIFLVAFSSWGYLAFGSESYVFHTFWRSLAYTCLIRNWKNEDSEIGGSNQEQFGAWKTLYVAILLACVIPFFRAVSCAAYKDGKLYFLSKRRRRNKDFSNYIYKVIRRKKRSQKKHVKFRMNVVPRRRSTMAASQQTISLGSDPGIPGHMNLPYNRMPFALRERLLNRLNPRTDEILAHVYQLEQDEYLEDEFFSRLESMTKNLDISDKLL